MSSIKVIFSFEKETKNTLRFAEEANGTGIVIGTLYIQKSVFEKSGLDKTDKLCVTIDAHEVS